MPADEIRRRLVHVGGATFPFAYLVDLHFLAGFELATWPRLRLLYLAGSFVAIALEFVRLVVGLEWWVFRQLTREYEETNPAGYALYTVGSTLAVIAFEPAVAIPALLSLAIVDPISGLLSRRDHRRVKRPHVLAVTFLLSFAFAAAFVPASAAVLGGLAVTVADGVKPSIGDVVLDDNFTIPVGASLALWLGVAYLPAI